MQLLNLELVLQECNLKERVGTRKLGVARMERQVSIIETKGTGATAKSALGKRKTFWDLLKCMLQIKVSLQMPPPELKINNFSKT